MWNYLKPEKQLKTFCKHPILHVVHNAILVNEKKKIKNFHRLQTFYRTAKQIKERSK